MSNPVITNCGKGYFNFFTEMNCIGAEQMLILIDRFELNGDARFICRHEKCGWWVNNEVKLWEIGIGDE